MKIYDIFSRIPEKELPLEVIQECFEKYFNNNDLQDARYRFLTGEVPFVVDENIEKSVDELKEEGKDVAFLIANDRVLAVIGYRT